MHKPQLWPNVPVFASENLNMQYDKTLAHKLAIKIAVELMESQKDGR